MRALILYCHPSDTSFAAAVRDRVVDRLTTKGAELRLIDLYGEGFNPVLSAEEWASQGNVPQNRAPVAAHAEALAWCDTLIFVFPTWWNGLPAMLKGWLDRVMLPGVAYHLPGDGGRIRPGLRQVRAMGIFTTGGANRWISWLMGQPGRRTLQRAIGPLCAPFHRRAFVVHYGMDTSSPASRAAHLDRVARAVDRLVR